MEISFKIRIYRSFKIQTWINFSQQFSMCQDMNLRSGDRISRYVTNIPDYIPPAQIKEFLL